MTGPASPIDRDLLGKLWRDGVETGAIAERFGVRPTSICRVAREMGLPKRERGRRPIDRAALAALWAGGMTLEEIAERLGVAPMSVSRAAMRYGFAPRVARRRAVKAPVAGTARAEDADGRGGDARPEAARIASRDGTLEAALGEARGYSDLAEIARRFGVSSQKVLSLWHRRRA